MNVISPPASSGPNAMPRRMSGWRSVLTAVTILALPVAMSCAQPSDPVIAKVNGIEIRQGDIALAEEELGQNLDQIPAANRRDYVIRYLADVILIARTAEAKKVAETADFKRRLSFARNRLLMETYLQSQAKAAITDAEIKKTYEEAVKEFGQTEEVHARHILVETEADANAIIDELKKGMDFAALAVQRSKDPGSKDGGDLGYFTREQMVPEFANVAFKLGKGELSGPVKSTFGWHVIKVEDKRTRAAPPIEQVKRQVEEFIVRKTQSDLIAKFRETGKIERLDQGAGTAKDPLVLPK